MGGWAGDAVPSQDETSDEGRSRRYRKGGWELTGPMASLPHSIHIIHTPNPVVGVSAGVSAGVWYPHSFQQQCLYVVMPVLLSVSPATPDFDLISTPAGQAREAVEKIIDGSSGMVLEDGFDKKKILVVQVPLKFEQPPGEWAGEQQHQLDASPAGTPQVCAPYIKAAPVAVDAPGMQPFSGQQSQAAVMDKIYIILFTN
jgi:hypothetical protein